MLVNRPPAITVCAAAKTKARQLDLILFININYSKPKQEENESIENYTKRLQEYNNKRKADEATNLEIHKNLLDTNWEDVMEDYITKAMHFNAIQDNKYMLFYAKNMLDKLRVYVKNEGFNNLQKDAALSTDEETKYVTRKDNEMHCLLYGAKRNLYKPFKVIYFNGDIDTVNKIVMRYLNSQFKRNKEYVGVRL